jgi:hypothetical protein
MIPTQPPMMPLGPQGGAGLPPELAAALGGAGAGPPPEQGGGLPPELLAALQGGGPGVDQGPPSPAHGDGIDSTEHLRLAIEHAQAALVAEPDDQDSQTLSKAVSMLYGILSNRQKQQDQAMGGNPAISQTLRRLGG